MMTLAKAIQTALSFHEKGEFAKAVHIYTDVIKQDPSHFQALNLLGLAYQQLECDQKALDAFELALKLINSNSLTHYSAGASALKLARHSLALKHTNFALILAPGDAKTIVNQGIALHKLGELEGARKSYSRAVLIDPYFAAAHFNLGCTLQEMDFDGALNLAVQTYAISIVLNPADPAVYNNIGNAFKTKKIFNEAIKSFQRALILNPSLAVTHYNKGTTEYFVKNYELAIKDLTKALELDPVSESSWNNIGNAFKELGSYADALRAYERVLILTSGSHNFEIFYNIGVAQHELGLYAEACDSYTKSLKLEPLYTRALNARAITHRHLRKFDQAISDFKEVLRIDPHFEYAIGNLLHTQMHIADWSDWGKYVQSQRENTELNQHLLSTQISNGQRVSHPFPVLALYDDPALNLKASQIWFLDKHSPPLSDLTKEQNQNQKLSRSDLGRRIRLAYFSADFHNHATAYLIAELLELHDKEDFEIFAISFGPETKDEMQSRIMSSVDHFLQLSHLTDAQIASLCRELEIDIAIDLKGYTLQSRFNIFMYRCAPIQVGYIGYPGTSGSTCIDYFIADSICVPEGDKHLFTEKIVFMPGAYQVNDSKRHIKPCTASKSEMGLPNNGFVFCCFNNAYKITPKTFENWMNILRQVQGSVLWLLEDSEIITKNLRSAAHRLEVDPDRLVFAKRLNLEEHLGRHIHADLFLDTLPYNAHTTASDALWAGLPVLTLQGHSFAARVASSLLSAIGLTDLITDSAEAYIQKAVYLALNPKELDAIKQTLTRNIASSSLFNTAQFALQIESAYKTMMTRFLKGEPVDHIFMK